MMGKNKSIYVLGYLGYETSKVIYGGQLTKTRYLYKQLLDEFGENNVHYIDTSNWKKNGFRLLIKIIKHSRKMDVVVLAPNRSGMKVLFPLFAFLKRIYKFKIVYPVIGSWIGGLLKKDKMLLWGFRCIDLVLPETEGLKEELSGLTSAEIIVQPTASLRVPIAEQYICNGYELEKYYFCTFSRVTKQKGIEDAIKGINRANELLVTKKCYLDIWGYVDDEYKEEFERLLKNNSEYVRYRGEIDINSIDDTVTQTLREYYMMIFPTYYPGEGYPTSIVEAYMSALPVIASDWKYNKEIVIDGITGKIVKVNDIVNLSETIKDMVDNPTIVIDMKRKCLEVGKNHRPKEIMKEMIKWIRSE